MDGQQKRGGDEKLIEPLLAIGAQIQILWPRAAVTSKALDKEERDGGRRAEEEEEEHINCQSVSCLLIARLCIVKDRVEAVKADPLTGFYQWQTDYVPTGRWWCSHQ